MRQKIRAVQKIIFRRKKLFFRRFCRVCTRRGKTDENINIFCRIKNSIFCYLLTVFFKYKIKRRKGGALFYGSALKSSSKCVGRHICRNELAQRTTASSFSALV